MVASKAIPAPSGGWNTRDALDEMDPTDAVILDNWIPRAGKVSIRNGYSSHSTGVTGEVESLISYHAGSNLSLIGACGTDIYNFTGGTASSLGTGFNSARWEFVNFNGYLLGVSEGADAPQQYDGTTLSASGWTGTSFTASSMDGINVFKNRVYLWDSSNQDFWYGAVNAITGTVTQFPLSRVGQFGGNLLAMITWNIDAGDGVDDLAVFVMSSGDVIVYQGSDPGSATDWALVGVYRIGQPVNKRSIAKVGGDVMITTVDDYVSLAEVLRKGGIGNSSKLSGALITAVGTSKSLDGWQSVLYPEGEMMIFNVPKSGGGFEQHVINTTTGAACRFTDIDANCWAVHDGELYFGGTDAVFKYGGNDDAGSAIMADGLQAWNDFGQGSIVNIPLFKPIFRSEGEINYSFGIGKNYQTPTIDNPLETDSPAPEWDTTDWDTVLWGGDDVVTASWRVAAGLGDVMAPRVKVHGKTSVSWLRTAYKYRKGRNV